MPAPLRDLERPAALSVVAGCYAVAGAAAAATALALPHGHPVGVALAADVVATVVVFAASSVLANASVYDPYWSVAPPVVAAAWTVPAQGVPARQWLVVALVLAWGVRLTANWAGGWRGFGHEDWRYGRLRGTTAGRLPWWLVNLAGIQLMPTLVVFLGMLSLWPALDGRRPLGPLDALAAAVTLAAIAVEAAADLQMRRFAADPGNSGRTIRQGLWRLSRHPNYLGEIGVWWGLWLFGLAAAPSWWWTVVGPLAMVALFRLVSIPMMDARSLARRPGYAEVMRRVPALVPRPRGRRLQNLPDFAKGPGGPSEP
jgi:steroid 5-alpha reductase family enzyme